MRFTSNWFNGTNRSGFDELLSSGVIDNSTKTVVEIGSWEGQSTSWLLDHICQSPDSVLYSIDPYPRELFHENMNELSDVVRHKLIHIPKPSYVALSDITLNSCDLIYIDGSHYPDDVLRDSIYAFDRLRIGGLMIFDDYACNIWSSYRTISDASMRGYLCDYDIRSIQRTHRLVNPPQQSNVVGGHANITTAINNFVHAFAPLLECIPVNVQSMRVYKKLGYSYDGYRSITYK